MKSISYSRVRFTLICVLFIFLFVNYQTFAQYFGQNKIQYQSFNFKIIKTDHFDIYYYPDENEMADEAALMAERWYARYANLFQHQLSSRQVLILYASSAQFDQTNTISGQLGEGTGGVTEPIKRRIVLPVGGSLAETNHVIGHELVHAFQYDITGTRGGAQAIQGPALERMPLWFVEGMAEYFSLGPDDPNTAMWMRDATKTIKKLPSAKKLEDPKYFPYRWGQALLAYIGGMWGDEKIPELLKSAGPRGDLYTTIKQVLGKSADSLSDDWHTSLHNDYDPYIKLTKSPTDYGPVLISEKHSGGKLNVAPVISPDGKQLIFFSEKDLFAIDLFLADAETGKVQRNIVKTELNPHFESIEFIYSAGAWDPTGDKIVFTSIVQGRPAFSLLNIKKDKVEREIRFKNLGEIINPSWSPDGRYIAFSALAGGVSDLFIYDLQADSLHRVTHDLYADLHPAWSPDGSKIAFITERFNTELTDLDIGDYQLAMYDVKSGQISQIPGFPAGKHINPQWSPDGNSLYFVSDYTGISNIYRKDLNTGDIYQITNLYSGISGITGISPAYSIASKTNRLVYSAYEDSKYNIYRIDSEDGLRGIPVYQGGILLSAIELPGQPAMLPPINRKSSVVLAYLNDPKYGFPFGQSMVVKKYHPKFSLNYIAQPYVVAGADRFGTQLGGGITLYWSDMLGNRNLATMFQIQSYAGLTDIAGLLGYQNNAHRINWGTAIEQIPFIYDYYNAGYTVQDSQLVYIEQQLRFRQINRYATGFLTYPFNRASRVEAYGGFQQISFKEDVITDGYDPYTGQHLFQHTDKLPVPSSLNLVYTNAAFVFDNSIFGATSPILGQRSRFEIQPTTGTISFYHILADYRHYFMPLRPFTIAVRGLHYGRYGQDSEDSRLYPIFLGYSTLIRGYNSGSFSASDCNSITGACPSYDRLFGTRIAVGNVELRFPLLGLLGIGSGYYGFLPLETGAFYDIGVAWTANEQPKFFHSGDRNWVRSYGGVIRMNFFGFLVAEVDYVNPIDRPNKGWYWEFNFTPGF
jgi:Tol biopolymer transport system component